MEGMQARWQSALRDEFFEMGVRLEHDALVSNANLDSWDLGPVSLHRLQSRGFVYSRQAEHCQGHGRSILVFMPARGELRLTVNGSVKVCTAGQFAVCYSEEPFQWTGTSACEVWCMKVSADSLTSRTGDVRGYAGCVFDADEGAAGVFSDYLRLTLRHCQIASQRQPLSLMGSQILELLAQACREYPANAPTIQSSVRAAHVGRIEAHIRTRLCDPGLSPASVAEACGISARYLHLLFKETGRSVSALIRDQRLQAAYGVLANTRGAGSVAQVAYRFGFGDHAQFSHAFRRKYGHPPSHLLRGLRPAGS